MNRFEEELLLEMANLQKIDTELPMNVWIDSAQLYKKGKHYKRLKFQLNKSSNSQPNNFASVSLDDCKVIDKYEVLNQKNCELSSKDMKEVENFAYNNKFALTWCCDKVLSEKIVYDNLILGGKKVSESEIEDVKVRLQKKIEDLYKKGYYDEEIEVYALKALEE